jgi:hypothetical protein
MALASIFSDDTSGDPPDGESYVFNRVTPIAEPSSTATPRPVPQSSNRIGENVELNEAERTGLANIAREFGYAPPSVQRGEDMEAGVAGNYPAFGNRIELNEAREKLTDDQNTLFHEIIHDLQDTHRRQRGKDRRRKMASATAEAVGLTGETREEQISRFVSRDEEQFAHTAEDAFRRKATGEDPASRRGEFQQALVDSLLSQDQVQQLPEEQGGQLGGVPLETAAFIDEVKRQARRRSAEGGQ